jgi:Dolichyl-phosphate-mannose-protein mannosyltransferase
MSDKLQFVDQTRQAKARRTLSAWRWWLPPAGLSLFLILVFADPFIGDWDALEYTISALRGSPSSMALGRGLFIFYNHGLYWVAHVTFGLTAERAYLVFKYAVVAQGVLTVIASWVLTRDLFESRHAATISALMVTFSPVFVIYSGQVMTDVPAQLLLTVALIVHLRGLKERRLWFVLVGPALLGAGVNLRETVGFYALWLVLAPFVCGWRFSRRTLLVGIFSTLIFLVCAGGMFGFWFLTDLSYRASWFGWRESMRTESALHPVSIRILWPWLAYFFAASPLIFISLPSAALSEWRSRRLSPGLLLAGVGLFANTLLLLNYSTAIGWRYLLTGLPALAPLCASYLTQSLSTRLRSQRRAFVTIATAIVLLGITSGVVLWPVRTRNVKVRTASKEYNQLLSQLPQDAVMISGVQTVAVKYWRAMGAGEWDVIGPGAGWPGVQLPFVIEDYLKSGRGVFLDLDPNWWSPCHWRVPEIEELATLQPRFRFRRVAQTVYEIRPKDDPFAGDQPHLEGLLPENRPEDVKKCLGPGGS